jgi:hypothetical protein
MTDKIHTMPAIDQYDFMFEFLLIFSQGVLAGLAFAWALGTRYLVPPHSFDRKRPAYGVITLSISIIYAFRAIMIATGEYTGYTNFPAGNETAHAVAAAIWIVLALFVIIVSYVGTELPILRWFVIAQKRDEKMPREYDRILPDFVIALALLLSPQAIWDFFTISPFKYEGWAMGLVTVMVEIVVWILVYFWFSKVRRIQSTLFSNANSVTSWETFCIFNAVAYAASGIVWIITLEVTSSEATGRFIFNLMLIAAAVAAIILFLIVRKRRDRLDEIGKPVTTSENPSLAEAWQMTRRVQ